ncbi:MAG: hypothetical protein A2289_14330 [Deltaproteobacteria bacterium RIFOXYA12_FULL_58_15]|nr:MAG: hypothetical protein A2289_14330 [Deltaproteobacteria bacterium RIFOXYA12_FULL_58_15]OGR13996.1 MAG: hypothetical protein A2341_24760 [Deltaproteobacteria bacterium RIFOXYB12_FULL_58_9]
MENWQLTLVILTSVFVGALIPLFIMAAVALYRASRAITEISSHLKGTLTQVEVISDRVEVLTRGLKGGEADIADLLSSVGQIARSLEHNMKIVNVVSTIIASIGTAIAAHMGTRPPVDETGRAPSPDTNGANGASNDEPHRSKTDMSSETTMDSQ